MTPAAAAALGAELRRRCNGDHGVADVAIAAVALVHQAETAPRVAPTLVRGFVELDGALSCVASRGPAVDVSALERALAPRAAPAFVSAPPPNSFVSEYRIASAFGFSARAGDTAVLLLAFTQSSLDPSTRDALELLAQHAVLALVGAREARARWTEADRNAARAEALEGVCDAQRAALEEGDRRMRTEMESSAAESARIVESVRAELLDRNQKLRRTQRAMLNVIEDLREAGARLEARVVERTRRYAATFEQAAVGIAEVGLDGRWLKVNARLSEIVGYSADELARLTFHDITHPDDLAADLAHVDELLRGDRTMYAMEKRYVRKGGSTLWVRLTAALVRREDGEPDYFIAVIEDIDESKRTARELEASVRFADQFVGMLGHDLRNPLNAIVVTSRLLQRTLGRRVDRERIDRVLASAARITNMVAQLLDLARSRMTGGIPVDRREVALDEVVRGTVDELQQVYPQRAVRSALAAGVRGQWDAGRLAQVVSNLVGNAFQHADPNRPIDVRVDERDGEAVLAVQSFGPPIPPEVVRRLFEPYRQGAVRGKNSQGLGLGLFISNQIVLAHGGRMEVLSSGEGETLFTIYLPLGVEAGVERSA